MRKKASATLGLLLATSFGIPWAAWAADIKLDKTTSYDGLTIPDGAQIVVPPGKVVLTALDLAQGGKIEAARGYRLSLSIDGRRVPLAAGHYKGDVRLTVAPHD